MTSSDDHAIDAARGQALDALAGRDLLASELEARLQRTGHESGTAAVVLGELRRQGLLDDHRVAIARVRRWRGEGRSDADIRGRLAAAGLGDADIEAVLAAATPDDSDADSSMPPEIRSAIEAIRRRGRGLDLSQTDAVRTLAARLARGGFDPDAIRSALRHCGIEDAALDDSCD
jgi:SOS response regulatory protein OraA/RecX